MPLKTTLPTFAMEWLTSPAPATILDPVEIHQVNYPIPPEVGTAWVESLALNDGIALYRAVHDMSPSPLGQLVHLLDVSISPSSPVFSAQIWLSGLAFHREYWHGRHQAPVDIIATPGNDTFRLHQAWDCNILAEGGTTSEMRSAVMPEATLITLLGNDVASALLCSLGLDGKHRTVVRAVPPHVSAALRDAFSSHLNGPIRRLCAQARVLDYLANLLNFSLQKKTERKIRRHKQRIQDLHDYLLRLEGRLPTLTELAKDFGLSARRLNAEFLAEYGKPIAGFMTDHRLQQAHEAIQSTSIPLKTLAARLGYSHVNHFIASFKRKFGYPPGSLRRVR